MNKHEIETGGYTPPILKQKGFENIVCISPTSLGASSVYRVSRPGVGDWIVKRIEKEYAVLYKAEKNILSTLRHDFLPIIFDVFEDAQALYIAMEYIPGESLQQLMKSEKQISEASARKYFIQLCELFEYLHSKDVIHKDCKPSNIMLSKHDNVYLIDFGISKSPGHNPSGKTHGYASPEQLKKLNTDDYRTDIYSLGATMYSLLLKEVPKKDSDPKIVAKNLKSRADVSKNFRQIILKCMAKKPIHRFSTMGDIKKSLLRKDWIWKAVASIVLMLLFTVVIFFGMRVWENETTTRLISRGNAVYSNDDFHVAMQYFERYIYRRPLSARGYERRRNLLLSNRIPTQSLAMFDDTEYVFFHYFIENSLEYRNTWVRSVDAVISYYLSLQKWDKLFDLLENPKVQVVVDNDVMILRVYDHIQMYYMGIAYMYYAENAFLTSVEILNDALERHSRLFYSFEMLNLRAVALLSHFAWDGSSNISRFAVYANKALAVAGENDAAQAGYLARALQALGF